MVYPNHQASILPSIQTPLGARPARFRRTRVLIIGCGDIGLRVASHLTKRVHVFALTSSAQRVPSLRAQGIVPLSGNLDHGAGLRRLAGLGHRVIHLAPPAAMGGVDARTQSLLDVLRRRTMPNTLVYGSTSGVYGDCGGNRVTESHALRAGTERAQRRVDAETRIRQWGKAGLATTSILRIPGIYAPDREGGTPRTRLLKGLPVLTADQDVYTNHIHADDLARACIFALWRGKPQRTYNVNDDTELKMGDYFDLAADLYGLTRPPRLNYADAAVQLSPMQLSFMQESRRLVNIRMKRELGMKLRYPTVHVGLA